MAAKLVHSGLSDPRARHRVREVFEATPAEIAVSHRGLTSETRYRKEAVMKPTQIAHGVDLADHRVKVIG